MDATRLSTKVFAGYGKAAKRVGAIHDVYRPTSTGVAIVAANKIASVNAAFTIHKSENFNFEQVSDYDGPLFHMLADPRTLQVGDYLNNPANPFGPFFIASITPAMPPLAVNCNRSITVFAPGPVNDIGVNGYGGSVGQTAGNIAMGADNDTALLSNWPASLLKHRVLREQYLPQDAGVATFLVLLPAYPGVVIRPGTILIDDLDNRFTVMVAEKQDFGWRLEAQQATT